MNKVQEVVNDSDQTSQDDNYLLSSPTSSLSSQENSNSSSTSDFFTILENSENTKRVKSMFTKKEDKKLIKLVKEYGDQDWALIASFFKDRTRRQCRERWKKYLCPSLNHSPWTSEEDELLLKKFVQIGPKWTLISKSFKNRTDISIKSRYIYIMRKIKKNKNSFDYNQENNYHQMQSIQNNAFKKCSLFTPHLKCTGVPTNQKFNNYLQSFPEFSSGNGQMLFSKECHFNENHEKMNLFQNNCQNLMMNQSSSEINSEKILMESDSEKEKSDKTISSNDIGLSDFSLESLERKVDDYWDEILEENIFYDFY